MKVTLRSIGLDGNLVYFALFNGGGDVISAVFGPFYEDPFYQDGASRSMVDKWMTEQEMRGYSISETYVICDNPDDAALLYMRYQ